MSDDKSPIEEDPLEWLKDLEAETRSLLGTCVRVSIKPGHRSCCGFAQGHLLLDGKHRLQEHITSRLKAYACGFTSHFELLRWGSFVKQLSIKV